MHAGLDDIDTQGFWYVSEGETIAVKQDADFVVTAVLVSGNPQVIDWDGLSLVSPSMRKEFTHGGSGDLVPADAVSPFGSSYALGGVTNVNYWYVLPVQEFLPRGTVLRVLLEAVVSPTPPAVVCLFGFKLFSKKKKQPVPA